MNIIFKKKYKKTTYSEIFNCYNDIILSEGNRNEFLRSKLEFVKELKLKNKNPIHFIKFLEITKENDLICQYIHIKQNEFKKVVLDLCKKYNYDPKK